MKKALISTITLILFLFFSSTYSQEYQEILRDIFYNAEFFLLDESYIDALNEYQKLYDRGYQNNANINYRIGVCYLNIPGEKNKAIPYLVKSILDLTPRYNEGIFKEDKAPYDAFLYLGNAYRINNELDKAIQMYLKYKELLDNEKSEMSRYADQEINACKNAKKAMENPVYTIKSNLGEVINSENTEFNPVVSADESVMVYMNSQKFYDAVMFTRKTGGEWSEPINITPQIQSDGDQYVNSISIDGTEIYLNKVNNFNSDIYYSQYQDNRWSISKPLNKNINTKYWESHACISADGEYLFFTSNRRGGYGQMDIYASRMDAEGEWGSPENLGPAINTELNEDHPFISTDGKILYFASQGHYNIGGYDLFYSEKLADESWSRPVNLGYPLNTTDDDLFFVPIGTGRYGYQALFADDSYGSRDIYRYEVFPTATDYLIAIGQFQPPDYEIIEPVEPEVPEEPAEEEPEEEMVEETEPEPLEEVKEPLKTYIITAVFFKFDDYSLTQKAQTSLGALVEIMNVFPELYLEATGHTDSKGPENYNLILSRRRANSVVEYLTNQGIEYQRIKASGVGELQPVAINNHPDGSDSPDGRKLNRRVEFKITKPQIPNLKVEVIKVPENLKME